MSNVQVQINQLPQATTLTGSELVPIVQNGQTRQVTVGQIASSPTLTQTFLTVTNQTSTLANSRYIGAGSGLIGTDNGAGLNYVLSLTGAPLALYNNTNGIQVKTGANTMSSVQIAVGTGLSISNPDGTGGNPTISLSSFLASLASVSGTGLLAVSGGSSATPVTLTGGTGITITNGNGSGGNPTFALSSSGVTAGSYTLSSVTVDNYGRVTSASSASTTGTGNVVLSASPALTGTPTAPTPSTGTNSTQIATTAFVLNQISASSSSGTVTSVGLTMPSGFSVSSSPITSSGTISVSTTLNGILKGTGSGFTTATSGTDYAPATSGTSLLYGNGSGGFSNVSIGSGVTFSGGTLSATGTGTVTSVGLSLPSIFTVTNSPVTTSGTLTASLAIQNANYVFAGPTSTSPGTPTFRALVSADIPSLNYAPPTSGTSILYANGSGGFSNVTIGTGITFSGGTLSAPSTMVYPGAGIPNSTGSAWGTSYSTTGTNKVVLSTAPTFDTTTAFTPIAQPSYAEGLLWYDSTQKALSYFNDVSNNVITIGQETQVKVRNGTGSTIAGGIAVYVTSTSSGAIYPNVAPAQANSLSTSAVIGLTTASIASGGVGYVITAGLLSPANTGAFTVGDILYLSPYSAGQIQNTIPPTGYAIQIGTVAYSNNPNGSIYVKQTTPLSVPASIITGTVAISQGGTGSTTASGALTALGAQPLLTTTSNLSLNQITAQVATLTTAQIQSLTVSQLTTLTTANVSNLVATGGTINGTTIGVTTASTGKFTTLESTGTATLGDASTTYIQIVGDASYPSINAVGGTNTPLVLQPLGTGALQAQKTDSTATGGNARGANAVDWQTIRGSATYVASGSYSFLGGGNSNASGAYAGVVVGGTNNSNGNVYSFVGAGTSNSASGYGSSVVGGNTNSANGYWNFIGGGSNNSGTSGSAVTTQATSTITSGSTAVTLSGSNASIKVGQLITGTPIANYTYVAAISGTSLTLSQNATSSTNATLSFYTPHGVVVGGGNNQATGSYSFVGGGGDAGTAGNRNVASGDWSFVGGGQTNTANANYGAVVGGNINYASGYASFVGSGYNLNVSSTASYGSILGGATNLSSGAYSAVLGGYQGTTRSIVGASVVAASQAPTSGSQGSVQSMTLHLGAQTTTATATVLTSNTSAAGTTNQVILPNNSAYSFRATIIAGVTGGGNTASWVLQGAIKRGASASATSIVSAVTSILLAQDSGASTWTVSATADTSNGGLAITVTGQASTTIRWVCKVETTEMTY